MTAGNGDRPSNELEPGMYCIHCGRRCGNLAGGFARFRGEPVCSKPTEPNRPDCYRMIVTKFHKPHGCPECTDRGGPTYPSPPRRSGQRLDLCP